MFLVRTQQVGRIAHQFRAHGQVSGDCLKTSCITSIMCINLAYCEPTMLTRMARASCLGGPSRLGRSNVLHLHMEVTTFDKPAVWHICVLHVCKVYIGQTHYLYIQQLDCSGVQQRCWWRHTLHIQQVCCVGGWPGRAAVTKAWLGPGSGWCASCPSSCCSCSR